MSVTREEALAALDAFDEALGRSWHSVGCRRTDTVPCDCLLGAAEAAGRAFHAYLEQPAWVSVESIPRDGRVILLTDGHHTYPASWTGGEKYPWTLYDGDEELNGMPDEKVAGWQPLPPPPEQGE